MEEIWNYGVSYNDGKVYLGIWGSGVLEFDTELPLGDDLTVTLKPVGHILGAACVTIRHRKQTIVFSGDLGRPNHQLDRGLR